MEHRSDISGDKVWNGNNSKFTSSNMSTTKQSNGCATETSSMSVTESHYTSETHSFRTSSLSHNFQEMKLSSETASTSSTLNKSPEKCSFIVQRVERLYGPGALAQGFYTRHKTRYSPPTQENIHEENNRVDTEESLPVLRLLRPEFRAQLLLGNRKINTPISSPQRNEEDNGEVKEHIIPIEIEGIQSKTDVPVIGIGERENETVSSNSPKDGHFYLKLVCKEVETLQRLAADIDAELETKDNIPEEFTGRLRAAAGKARLLATQKLAQFQGLCKKNINQDRSEDFPTTCEDLAGFWDMVSIQINSVHEEFENINKLKASGWIKEESLSEGNKPSKSAVANGASTSRRIKGNPTTSRKSTSVANKARDEERKRLIEERRKAMRKNQKSSANEDSVFISAE